MPLLLPNLPENFVVKILSELAHWRPKMTAGAFFAEDRPKTSTF